MLQPSKLRTGAVQPFKHTKRNKFRTIVRLRLSSRALINHSFSYLISLSLRLTLKILPSQRKRLEVKQKQNV